MKCSVNRFDGASSRAGHHPRLSQVVTVDGEVGRVLLKPVVAR